MPIAQDSCEYIRGHLVRCQNIDELNIIALPRNFSSNFVDSNKSKCQNLCAWVCSPDWWERGIVCVVVWDLIAFYGCEDGFVLGLWLTVDERMQQSTSYRSQLSTVHLSPLKKALLYCTVVLGTKSQAFKRLDSNFAAIYALSLESTVLHFCSSCHKKICAV